MNKLIRIIADAHRSCPVRVIPDSDSAPEVSGYYCRKSRWSFTPSTLLLSVGQKWLDKMQLDQIMIDGTPTIRACGLVRRVNGYMLTPAHVDTRRCILVARHCRFFHAPRTHAMRVLTDAEAQAAIAAAVAGWAAQDAAKIAAKIEREQLASVWVGIDHSISAGNCRAGTEYMAAVMRRKLRAVGDIGAVRADVLLLARDDRFTRRAIAAAMAT